MAKSEAIFWKECMITEQWKRVMLHNQNHKIVHSSATYYQNLIIIHECSICCTLNWHVIMCENRYGENITWNVWTVLKTVFIYLAAWRVQHLIYFVSIPYLFCVSLWQSTCVLFSSYCVWLLPAPLRLFWRPRNPSPANTSSSSRYIG